MNKEDRENIRQAVADIIFGITDNESLEGLKEYCVKEIKDGLEDAITNGLKEIDRSKETCRSSAIEARQCYNTAFSHLRKMEEIVDEWNTVRSDIEKSVSKYETIKRMAEEVTNNAVIDGFECSTCGCIVKNINVNGRWTKIIRFCPNCGGENIQYKQPYADLVGSMAERI